MKHNEINELQIAPGEYEAPRIISHSAEHLKGMTIDVNACNSNFGGGRIDESSESDEERAVTY